MKILVTVNPITLKPTNFLLPPWIEPILSGQYQNAAEVDEAEWLNRQDHELATMKRRLEWLKSISPKS